MPFPLIPTALGICFLLVWAFIGGMTFRDRQLALRHERDEDINILPVTSKRSKRLRGTDWQQENRDRLRTARAAS